MRKFSGHHGYGVLKKLIEEKRIETLTDIFGCVPSSILAKDLGINYNRFHRIINDFPIDICFREIVRIAELIGVEPRIIFELAYNHYVDIEREKKGEPKKSKCYFPVVTRYTHMRKY